MAPRSTAAAGRPGTGAFHHGPWRAELRATTRLAVPMVLTQISTIALNTTDVVMTGWLGPQFLAGVSLGNSLYFPCMLFAVGVLAVTSAMMAQDLGARRFKGVPRTVRQGLWVILFLTVPMAVPLWFGTELLLLLGQDPTAAALAGDYLDAAMWGLAPTLGYILLRNFAAAHGRPRAALVVILIGILVNAVADYALMFGRFGLPRLELFGCGIATTLVNCFMFAALLGFALRDRRFRRYRLLAGLWRPDWPRWREIMRLGAPVGLTVLAETGLFSAAGLLVGLTGPLALAGHTVALQCAGITFMIPLGIAQAMTVRVGLAAGAGRRGDIGRAGWSGYLIGTAAMLASGAALALFRHPIAGLFIDSGQEGGAEALQFATGFLLIAAAFQLVDGGQILGLGALRGLKDTRMPLMIAAAGYWGFGFGSAVLFGFVLDLGATGIWWGLLVGLTMVALTLTWRFHRRERYGLVAAAGEPGQG